MTGFGAFLFPFLAVLTLPAFAADATPNVVRLRLVSDHRNAAAPLPGKAAEFDLLSSRDRAYLKQELRKLLELAEAQKADPRRNTLRAFPYEISGGKRRGLEKCLDLLELVEKGGTEGREARYWIEQVLASFHYAYDYPIKGSYQLLPEVPYYLAKGFSHQKVRYRAGGDGGRTDPAASSYWAPRANDGTVDLKAGFGRAAPADVENEICSYKEPKSGWGAHPGFSVECGGTPYKFKLGDEIYSGPFNTRIFWLLGYNVTPIDRVDELKVAYDRRILSEFHSRKHLELRIRLLVVPVMKHVITQYSDPFTWIQFAQLRDGTRVSGAELKRKLLRRIPAGDPTSPKYERPESIPGNFREEFESRIEFLAFVPGAIAADPDDVKSIGPWKYNELGAPAHREIRALMLLSAWVDEYNMRWENTRLSVVKEGKGQWSLRHYLSDVGSGLGGATRLGKMMNSEVGEMPWRVTKPSHGGVKLKWFQQNDTDNRAFSSMTYADAQWMARKIAGLSEAQIWDALGAARMPAAERRLAFEKLLSRRVHMLRDFGLAREFPAILRRPIDERFSFTPTAADGYGWDKSKVVRGELVERD